MAWIESHQELGRHWKTKRLARALGISLPTAVGHMQFIWWWALDFAQDGDLSGFEDREIADEALWEGDPATFRAALIESGFLDAEGSIHDWDEYAKKLIDKRKANAERMREARAAHKNGVPDKRAAHVQSTLHARAGATVPDRTGQNSTEPETGAGARTREASASDAAPPPPAALEEFHSILSQVRGYDPSPEFFANVLETFGHLNLAGEALKLASWIKERPRTREPCSQRRVLNWLETAEKQRSERGKEVSSYAPGSATCNGIAPAARAGVRHG